MSAEERWHRFESVARLLGDETVLKFFDMIIYLEKFFDLKSQEESSSIDPVSIVLFRV